MPPATGRKTRPRYPAAAPPTRGSPLCPERNISHFARTHLPKDFARTHLPKEGGMRTSKTLRKTARPGLPLARSLQATTA